MYEVENDTIYCYPGTDVLKNKLDIRDAAELAAFEIETSNQRAQEPIARGDLDYAFYCALHKHLFQDVYNWAGELRKVRIGKAGNWFCFPENIDAEMTKLFASLARQNNLASLSRTEFAKKSGSLFGGAQRHSSIPRRKWTDPIVISWNNSRRSRPST
jgi:cell filamentation protein